MKLSLGAVALAFALAACAGNTSDREATTDSVGELNASAPITLANWISHPKIVEVRRVVEEIDAAKFAAESKEMCQDAGHGEVERTKLTDAHLTIRELVVAFGSEDSAMTDSYYYDAAGTLRFAFRTRNDVHGNQNETRVYFDAQGKSIWEIGRHAFDPNLKANITTAPYTLFEDVVVLEELAASPAKLWDSPPRCD